MLEKSEGMVDESGGEQRQAETTQIGARNHEDELEPLSVSTTFSLNNVGDLEQSMHMAQELEKVKENLGTMEQLRPGCCPMLMR